MAICDLLDLPRRGVLLGLDPGRRTIGVAASDHGQLIASPVEALSRGRRLAPVLSQLEAIASARTAIGIVVGMPFNMDGSEGPSAQSARALARHVSDALGLPVAFQDERLSTAQAERDMIASDVRREKRSGLIDASAAAIILQTAIDRLAND
ncbi:MAG: Holliday junction resolvase RuvX [Pseudomonadota bacterium]